MTAQGSVVENTRATIRGLRRIRNFGEEEGALKELLEDVQDRKAAT